MKLKHIKWPIIALLLASSFSTRADEIRINFGESSPGGNWNSADKDLGLSNLVDFNTGAGTGVDLGGSGFSQNSSSASYWTPTEAQDWVLPSVGDNLIVGLSAATMSFSGLSENSYKVEVLSAYGVANFFTASYVVNGSAADNTYNGTSVPTTWDPGTHGTQNSNWLIWDKVDTSGGVIDIGISSGNWMLVNAVRISSVPEPASLALISLFGGGMIAIRRRFLP